MRILMAIKDRMLAFWANERALMVGLFLFAFGLRFVYLNQIKTNPFFDVPLVDSETYVEHAKKIAGGDWLGEGPFWQAPLYPYLLGAIYTIFGEGYYLPRLIQFAIGSLSCVLIYLIARRIFNKTVGVIASLLASLYGIFIYFEGELLAPSLEVFLALVLILSLMRAGEAPSVRRWLFSGLILGLAAITRPNVLLFAPFALTWIWFLGRGGRRKAEPLISLMPSNPPHLITQIPHPSPRSPKNPLVRIVWKRPILWTGYFCLGVILVISVMTLRNYIVGGDFVLISSNAGVNFYIGNNPEYDHTVGIRPGPDWEELVGMPKNEGITKPSQKSRYFLSKSWEFIKEQPFDYFLLLLKKFRLFWSGDEIKRNQDIYFLRGYSSLLSLLLWKRVLAFPFGLIAPLALTGVILSLKRWRSVLLLLLFIFAYMLSVILFFVCSRYRVPVIPFLIIFGAYTIWWWSRRVKDVQHASFFISFVLFVALSLGVNYDIGEMNPMGDPEIRFSLGYAYERKGMYARSAAEYKEAVELDPSHMRARNNLATVYALRGMYDRAILEYKKALEIGPDRGNLSYNLATAYMRKGMYDEAINYYKKAMSSRINYESEAAHSNFGYAYMRKGMFDGAAAEYEKAIQIDPDYVDAHYNLGFVYWQKGMNDKAIAEYERTIELKPDHAKAENNLGIIYAQMGMHDEAIARFKRALEIDPDYVDAHHNLAVAYEEKGMYSEAVAEYKAALDIKPNYAKVHYELALLYYKMGERELAAAELEKYNLYVSGGKALDEVEVEELLEKLMER